MAKDWATMDGGVGLSFAGALGPIRRGRGWRSQLRMVRAIKAHLYPQGLATA